MRTRSMFELLVFIGLTALAARLLLGCTPQERVLQSPENALAVIQYERLLDGCKDKARKAHDYAVFEKCADEVDAMLCTVNTIFCNDGGTR